MLRNASISVLFFLIFVAKPLFAQEAQEIFQKSFIHCQNGQFSESEKLLEEAERQNPKSVQVYNIRGCIYEGRNNDTAAIKQYKKWMESSPESFEPYYELGRITKVKHPSESNLYFEQAKRLNPTHPRIANEMCDNFVRLREWKSAIQTCSEQLLQPCKAYEERRLFRNRSIAYFASGEFAKAQQDLEKSYDKREYSYGELAQPFVMLFQFFALACCIFMPQLRVIIRGHPLVSQYYFFLPIMVAASSTMSNIIIPLFMGIIYAPDYSWLNYEYLMYVGLAAFIFIQMVIIERFLSLPLLIHGLSYDQAVSALLSTLEKMGLKWQRSDFLIYVESENLTIDIRRRFMTTSIINENKENKESFNRIINQLRIELANHKANFRFILKNILILCLLFGALFVLTKQLGFI